MFNEFLPEKLSAAEEQLLRTMIIEGVSLADLQFKDLPELKAAVEQLSDLPLQWLQNLAATHG